MSSYVFRGAKLIHIFKCFRPSHSYEWLMSSARNKARLKFYSRYFIESKTPVQERMLVLYLKSVFWENVSILNNIGSMAKINWMSVILFILELIQQNTFSLWPTNIVELALLYCIIIFSKNTLFSKSYFTEFWYFLFSKICPPLFKSI